MQADITRVLLKLNYCWEMLLVWAMWPINLWLGFLTRERANSCSMLMSNMQNCIQFDHIVIVGWSVYIHFLSGVCHTYICLPPPFVEQTWEILSRFCSRSRSYSWGQFSLWILFLVTCNDKTVNRGKKKQNN